MNESEDLSRGSEPLTETTIRCDRCHRVIEAERTLLDVRTGLRASRPELDFCPKCLSVMIELNLLLGVPLCRIFCVGSPVS